MNNAYISDDIICVHDTKNSLNIQQICQLPKTRGASLFALNIQRTESLTGKKNTVVRLCVAVKRKLQLYYWKKNHFEDLGDDLRNELSVAEVPRELSW